MRKKIFGRRLKRDTNERKALFRSLIHSMVMQGKIRTSEAKAKAIKGEFEKLITLARGGGDNVRASVMAKLPHEAAVDKLIKDIAPLFVNRPGGYTRIVRLGTRLKDGASMVQLSFVEEVIPTSFKEEKRSISKKAKTKSKETKKAEVKSKK